MVGDAFGALNVTFLEPACGSGNFLVEILRRKLRQVNKSDCVSQEQCEHRLLRVLASIYGVDISQENVTEARARMAHIILDCYQTDANTVEPTLGLVNAAALAGIPSGVRSLAAVTGLLGITNTNPHEALGDAVATARVLIEEFERVAALDHTDIEDLLVTLGGPQTAQDVPAGAWIADRAGIGFVGITKEHAEQHSTVLPAAPSKKRLRAWEDQIGTCADLRCGHIIDAVNESPAPSTNRWGYRALVAPVSPRAQRARAD